MYKLIQFRDQGCQGARAILDNTIALSKNNQDNSSSQSNVKRLVYLLPSENSNQKSLANISTWQDVANNISLNFAKINSSTEIQKEDIVILDEVCLNLADDIEDNINPHALILDANVSEFESPYALACITNLAYLALHANKPYQELSVNWMGDAGTASNNMPITFLNASICTQSFFGFAFENNPALADLYLPEKELLDFAMGAGSKIFLTHDPVFLDEDADLLYIAPWTYKDSQALKPQSHPFTYDAIKEAFKESTQIVSLIPEVKSSPLNEDLITKVRYNARLAALLYFLAK